MQEKTVYQFISFEMTDITDLFRTKLGDLQGHVRELSLANGKVRTCADDPYASFTEANARLIKTNIQNKLGIIGLILIGHYRGNGIAKVIQCVPESMRHLVVIASHHPLDEKQRKNYQGLNVMHFALRERHDDETSTPSFLEIFAYFAKTGKVLERAASRASQQA